jgi:MFS family permease
LTLYILVLIGALNQAMHTGGRVAVALTALGLHTSPFVLGTVTALYGVLSMGLAVPAGKLNDRIGSRVPMFAGCVMYAAGAIVPAVYPSLPSLYLAALLIGVGNMTFQVSVQNVVGLLGRQQDRTRNFSALSIGVAGGAIAGPLIAGYTIDYAGFEPSFIVLALLPIASLVLLGVVPLALPEPQSTERSRSNSRMGDLVGNSELRGIFIITGLHVMSWELFTFLVPIQGTYIGLSASTIGIIMGAFSAATFFIRMVLPQLAARFAPWHLIKGALVLAGVIFIATPLFTQVPILIALAFVFGCGMGASQPLSMALLHDAAPAGRAGDAVGIRTMVVAGAQTSMPLIFGGLGSALGMTPIFWAVAFVLWAGVAATKTGAVRAPRSS